MDYQSCKMKVSTMPDFDIRGWLAYSSKNIHVSKIEKDYVT